MVYFKLMADIGAKHGDFVHFLHDIAEELGVVLNYGSKVTTMDVEQKMVKLENGQTFTGDIIVGADGPDGISRSMFDSVSEPEALVNVYR
jgi:salicylate hydroxylase